MHSCRYCLFVLVFPGWVHSETNRDLSPFLLSYFGSSYRPSKRSGRYACPFARVDSNRVTYPVFSISVFTESQKGPDVILGTEHTRQGTNNLMYTPQLRNGRRGVTKPLVLLLTLKGLPVWLSQGVVNLKVIVGWIFGSFLLVIYETSINGYFWSVYICDARTLTEFRRLVSLLYRGEPVQTTKEDVLDTSQKGSLVWTLGPRPGLTRHWLFYLSWGSRTDRSFCEPYVELDPKLPGSSIPSGLRWVPVSSRHPCRKDESPVVGFLLFLWNVTLLWP